MEEKTKQKELYYPPLEPEQSVASKFITAIVIIGIILLGVWILSWLYPNGNSPKNLPDSDSSYNYDGHL